MADGTPVSSPDPVLVAPVPAGSSRTIFWTKVVAWFGGVFGLLPEALITFADLMKMEAFAGAVNGLLPERARSILLSLGTIAAAWQFYQLRKKTAGPIAGTPLEAELSAKTESAQQDVKEMMRLRH